MLVEVDPDVLGAENEDCEVISCLPTYGETRQAAGRQ